MPIAVDELIARATGGLPLESRRLFRPSLFYFLLNDPFWIHCEYHVSAAERRDETTEFDRLRMEQGNQWERRYAAERFPAAYVVAEPWGEPALRETLAAMVRGEPAILHGSLWDLPGETYGQADVLVRCNDGSSDLGDYYYRVQEVKNSTKLKDHYPLQAAAYAHILGKLQGRPPQSFDVVLGDGQGVVTLPWSEYAERLDDGVAQWRNLRDGACPPRPPGHGLTRSPWRQYAHSLLAEAGDVTLLPKVGAKTAAKWRARGYRAWDDLLAAGPARCRTDLGNDDAYYHALAYRRRRPVFRPGERVRIRRRRRLVYFDVEDIGGGTSSIAPRPHTYMIGVAEPDGSTQIWTARGGDDEERIWAEFLAWLGDPDQVALYCWSPYESRKLRQAAQDHPRLAASLMAANDALIDLKEEIRRRPFFPVPTYSIKAVAPACGFDWSQDDVDGLSAQLLYCRWLETGDAALIEKVEQYNREDVLAMLAVDRYVSALEPAED